jgi:hypothetical protein
MSLLQTRFIVEGSRLAYTGAPVEDGQSFIWGNAKDFDLERGDVVQVLEINRRDGSPWARVVVAVLKGKCCGRIGQISIDMSARLQRSWQRLTMTGSMEPVRATGKHRKLEDVSNRESGLRVPDHKTTPSPAVKATFEGDEFGTLSFLQGGKCG